MTPAEMEVWGRVYAEAIGRMLGSSAAATMATEAVRALRQASAELRPTGPR